MTQSFVFAALLGASACVSFGEKPSALQERVSDGRMSPRALRMRVHALAFRFSGRVEELADDLALQAPSAERRLELTRFKINGVPHIQLALLRADPVMAIIDAWALLAQLGDALVRTHLTPEQITLAREGLASMEGELGALWSDLTGQADVSETERRVHAWAKENPIGMSLASRPSTVPLFTQLLNEDVSGLAEAAAALLSTTDDLVTRIDLQVAFLPKQARWQAEYLVGELLTQPTLTSTSDGDGAVGASPLLQAVEEVGVLANGVPSLLARERRAVLGALHEEMLATQGFVSRERVALVDDLRGERVAVLGALREERIATLSAVDRMGQRWVDQAFDRTQGLVDRILVGLLLLSALMLLGALAVALMLVRGWKSRTHPPPPRGRPVPAEV